MRSTSAAVMPSALAAATRAAISEIVRADSSVSTIRRSAGIIAAVSGLKRSPNDRQKHSPIIWRANSGLPRNP